MILFLIYCSLLNEEINYFFYLLRIINANLNLTFEKKKKCGVKNFNNYFLFYFICGACSV